MFWLCGDLNIGWWDSCERRDQERLNNSWLIVLSYQLTLIFPTPLISEPPLFSGSTLCRVSFCILLCIYVSVCSRDARQQLCTKSSSEIAFCLCQVHTCTLGGTNTLITWRGKIKQERLIGTLLFYISRSFGYRNIDLHHSTKNPFELGLDLDLKRIVTQFSSICNFHSIYLHGPLHFLQFCQFVKSCWV